MNELKDKLQDILDLLRTGTPPVAFGWTFEQWNVHKINKCAGELQRIIDELKESK